VTALVVRRSVLGTVRQPGAWLPGLLLPLLILVTFAANYGRAGTLLGLPGGLSYASYVLPGIAALGACYDGIAAGALLTDDLATGYLGRLRVTPARTWVLLAGPVAAAALQAIAASVLFALVLGAPGGAARIALLAASTALLAAGVAGLAATVGLRTADKEVMESLSYLLFILMFISSAFFPPALMRGWFGAVATHSPLTLLLDGLRDGHAPPALIVPAALCAITLPLAGRSIRS
jgi:ABC-2 type transport system permease protein